MNELTAASAVIFNDFAWTPMAHQQGEGRVWGRLNDLHGALVYYVQVKNTIDSFMMQTLARKQTLIDKGVDGQGEFARGQESLLKDFLTYLKENR